MRDEIIGSRRNLRNEQFRSLYSSSDLKQNEVGRTLAHTGEKRNAYRVLVGNSEGNKSLRRSECR
jgi:hypothetical protein